MSGFLIVFCTEIDIMIQISISIIFSWVVSLHSAPNYGHPSGPLFFPCGLQALRFNFWHREQGLTGFYISESFDPPCPWCVKPMSWRALILASFFFSAKRIRDTISELLGSLQWLAISQQKAQLLSGLPSLSLRLVSWEGHKLILEHDNLSWVDLRFLSEKFQVLFSQPFLFLVTQISVWSSLWFQKIIVTRFRRFEEPLGLPTDNILMVWQGGREDFFIFLCR